MNTVKKIRVYIEEAEDKSKSIQLPVLPASFMIDDGQNNVVVNITSLGDANLPGKKALRELTLASFFPNQDYLLEGGFGNLVAKVLFHNQKM